MPLKKTCWPATSVESRGERRLSLCVNEAFPREWLWLAFVTFTLLLLACERIRAEERAPPFTGETDAGPLPSPIFIIHASCRTHDEDEGDDDDDEDDEENRWGEGKKRAVALGRARISPKSISRFAERKVLTAKNLI